MDRVKLKLENSERESQRDSFEYLLVAYPDSVVERKITEIKREFSEKYKNKLDDAVPSISAGSFLAREDMEETLIRWIQRICGQLRSFPVTLNNYSGIPLHTIYLRVFDHQPFRQLAKNLQVIDQYIKSNGCPDAKLTTRPYMPIARDLKENQYERAMKDYSLKSFCETFRVNELVLLRKNMPEDAHRKVTVFSFLP